MATGELTLNKHVTEIIIESLVDRIIKMVATNAKLERLLSDHIQLESEDDNDDTTVSNAGAD